MALPLAYFFADLAETLYTRWALNCRWLGEGCDFKLEESHAWPIHLLSNLKWLALVVTVVVVIGLYFNARGKGRVSWQRRRDLRRLAADRQKVDGPPVGAVVVVLSSRSSSRCPAVGRSTRCPTCCVPRSMTRRPGTRTRSSRPVWAFCCSSAASYVVAFSVIRRTASVPPGPDAGPAAPKAVSVWVVLVVAAVVSGGLLALHRHLRARRGS